MAYTVSPAGVEDRQKILARKEAKKLSKAKRETAHANKARLEYKRKNVDWQHEKTQKVFNKLRRLEEFLWFYEQGLEPECISCGKIKMDWCCGHFMTVGASGVLRYEPKNTYLQCNFRCNRNLSGNRKGNATTRGYEAGLVDRFGVEPGKEIISWCENNQYQIKRWEWQELELMRKGFNARIRKLEIELDLY